MGQKQTWNRKHIFLNGDTMEMLSKCHGISTDLQSRAIPEFTVVCSSNSLLHWICNYEKGTWRNWNAIEPFSVQWYHSVVITAHDQLSYTLLIVTFYWPWCWNRLLLNAYTQQYSIDNSCTFDKIGRKAFPEKLVGKYCLPGDTCALIGHCFFGFLHNLITYGKQTIRIQKAVPAAMNTENEEETQIMTPRCLSSKLRAEMSVT